MSFRITPAYSRTAIICFLMIICISFYGLRDATAGDCDITVEIVVTTHGTWKTPAIWCDYGTPSGMTSTRGNGRNIFRFNIDGHPKFAARCTIETWNKRHKNGTYHRFSVHAVEGGFGSWVVPGCDIGIDVHQNWVSGLGIHDPPEPWTGTFRININDPSRD